MVMGDTPQWLEIKPLQIEAGRFINALDIAEKRKVTVIGTMVRDQLFDAEDAVTKLHVCIRTRRRKINYESRGSREPNDQRRAASDQ